MFSNLNKFKILCVPNFTLVYDNWVVKAAIAFIKDTKKLYISKNMLNSINKCREKKHLDLFILILF